MPLSIRLSAPLRAPPRSVPPLPPPTPRPHPRAQEELVNNTELVQSYRQQIGNVVNQANLQLFWNMYNRCGRHGAQLGGTRPQGARCRGALSTASHS